MTASELLQNTKVEVSGETYAFVSVSHRLWRTLLESPELSPAMTNPFMIFMDKYEVSLLLDRNDLGTIRHAIRDAKIESGLRLLTFDTVLDFSVIGFIARVAGILADAGISIFPVSAFSRDHLLVKQDDLAAALKALGPHVAELC